MNPVLACTLFGSVLISCTTLIRDREPSRRDLSVALGLISLLFVIAIPQKLGVLWHPATVDLQLYRLDRSIGLDPLALCRIVLAHLWLHWLLRSVYSALPLMFAVAYTAERSRVMVRACVVGAILGWTIYNFVPAVGPVYVFSDFPLAVGHLMPPASCPRNCFPSMHLGWTLLIAFNCRSLWLRAVSYSVVVLTAAATIGLGEHYYVDLIAAIPFALAVQWWASKAPVSQ